MPFFIAVFTAALIVGFSTGSSAVTLSVSPDKLTYSIGETITLTVTGDDEGASTYGIYGRLLYNGALMSEGTRSQTQLVGPLGNWSKGSLQGSEGGFLGGNDGANEVFNQIAGLYAQTANNLPGVVGTATLIAQALGVVNVSWDIGVGTHPGFALDFFGLTNAPGTSFTIVPEPGTVALVAFGLLGLSGWRRVRD